MSRWLTGVWRAWRGPPHPTLGCSGDTVRFGPALMLCPVASSPFPPPSPGRSRWSSATPSWTPDSGLPTLCRRPRVLPLCGEWRGVFWIPWSSGGSGLTHTATLVELGFLPEAVVSIWHRFCHCPTPQTHTASHSVAPWAGPASSQCFCRQTSQSIRGSGLALPLSGSRLPPSRPGKPRSWTGRWFTPHLRGSCVLSLACQPLGMGFCPPSAGPSQCTHIGVSGLDSRPRGPLGGSLWDAECSEACGDAGFTPASVWEAPAPCWACAGSCGRMRMRPLGESQTPEPPHACGLCWS